MTLIKPIAYFQKKKVGGVVPPPPALSDVYIASQDFFRWDGTQLGSATAGGIAKISPLGVLNTSWTNNANPSPSTDTRFSTKVSNGKIYADCRTTNSSTQRLREIDEITGVVNREVVMSGTVAAVSSVPAVSTYFFLGGAVALTLQGTSTKGIAKIDTSTMTVDSTFSTNIGTGPGAALQGIGVSSTKVVPTGNFTSFNGNTANDRFVVLNHDGTLDSGFTRATGNFNNAVASAAFFDNKLILGGQFTTYNGVTQQRIIAFNLDGSLNTTFNTNTQTIFNNNILHLYAISSTQLLVFGVFTAAGEVSNRICILNGDGTVATNRFGTGFNQLPRYVAIDSTNDLMYITGNRFTEYNGTTGLANAISLKISDGTINTNFVTGQGMRTTANGVSLGQSTFF